MIDNLDLDVNNYSINDIAKLFRLDSNKNYKANEITMRELEIVSEIMRTSEIENRRKTSIIHFFDEIKNVYIHAKCKPEEPTIPLRSIVNDRVNYPLSRDAPPSREEELVPRKMDQFIYTQNSEYFTGTINPLDKRIIKKCLTIDSKFRENYNTTKSQDFFVNLNDKLSKVVSMELASFEFPICFYGISASYGNNFLNLDVTFNDISGQTGIQTINSTVIIPNGNYNANDFISILNNSIATYNNINDPSYAEQSQFYYMFKYVQLSTDLTQGNSGTGKVIIVNNSNPVTYSNARPSITPTSADVSFSNSIISIGLDFTKDINRNSSNAPLTTRIGFNLGFTQPKYTGNITYIGDTVIEPCTIRYFYLAIDDYNRSVNNTFITTHNTNFLNNNIIARISLTGSYFSITFDNKTDLYADPRKYFGPVDINKLHIQIYDDHGRIMDMNNSNFSFSLIFEILYDL